MKRLNFCILIFMCCFHLSINAQKTELILQTGHSGEIISVAYSPDSKIIATAGRDSKIIIWRASDLVEIREIAVKFVADLCFTNDSKCIVFGNAENVVVMDVNTGEIQFELKGHKGWIRTIDISADNKYLISSSDGYQDNGTIILWDLVNRQILKTIHERAKEVVFNHAGNQFACNIFYSNDDGENSISIFDLQGNNIYKLLPQIRTTWDNYSSKDFFNSINYSNDDSQLMFIRSANGRFGQQRSTINQIELLNLSTKYSKVIEQRAKAVLFSPTGEILSNGQSLNLVNANTGENIRNFENTDLSFGEICFSPGGKYIAGSFGNKLKIWEDRSGKELYNSVYSKSKSSYSEFIFENTFLSKDKEELYIAIPNEKDVEYCLLNLHLLSSKLITKEEFPINEIKHAKLNIRIEKVFDKKNVEEKYIVVVKNIHNGAIQEFEVESSKTQEQSPQNSFAQFMDSGNYFILPESLSNPYGYKLHIWNSTNNKKIGVIDTKSGGPDAPFVVLDKNKILIPLSMTGNAQIWDVTNCKKLVELENSANLSNIIFLSDSTHLAGTSGNKIEIFDLASGKQTATLTGINKVPIGKLIYWTKNSLISIAEDGQINFWDIEKQKELLGMIFLPDNSNVCYTPEGYYFSTKTGANMIYFKYKSDYFSFEQFDMVYNRPDLVLNQLPDADSSLINTYYSAYQKRLKYNNINNSEIENHHIPKIEITNKDKIPYTIAASTITLNIAAKDSLFKLKKIVIKDNGVSLFGNEGINLLQKSLNSYEGKIDVPLTIGDNKIKIYLENEKGIRSNYVSIRISNTSELTKKPKAYIFAIGISDYLNNDFDLEYAAKDAKDFSEVLKNALEDYDTEITTILDKDATKEKILGIKNALDKTNVEDLVILFYAGHGLLDDNFEYYFGTTDIDFYDISKRGLKYKDFEGLLNNIPARKKIIFIDACHAGEIDKEGVELSNTADKNIKKARGFNPIKSKKTSVGLKNSFELMKEIFVSLQDNSGAIVISSAGGAEYAYEGDLYQNGVFTYAVIEGLKLNKADFDDNGAINISELKKYVIRRVSELTKGLQNPTSRSENIEQDILLKTTARFRFSKLKFTPSIKTISGFTNWVRSIDISPNDDKLIAGSRNQIIIYDLKTYKTIADIRSLQADVSALSFSPDGNTFVSAGGLSTMQFTSELILWSSSGQMIKKFNTDDNQLVDVKFSPDGKNIVTAGYKMLN